MPRLTSPLALFAVGALGCVAPADLPDEQIGTTAQALIDCDTWVCGTNSPVISTYHFHELNTRGLPNAEGFSIVSLWRGGIDYELSVERGRIVGRSGSLELRGPALTGAQIRLRQGAKLFAIQITAVEEVETFASGKEGPGRLESYQLDVGELIAGASPTRWSNLCGNPPPRTSPDVAGMNTYHSLVFEGERIDPKTKTIDPVLDPTWFNIGCAGHTLAKIALNGENDVARQVLGLETTTEDNQAFLKMLTADYCGTGRTFTVAGQPLQWMESHGYTKYLSDPAALKLEARWSPKGAACLNTPRVTANPTQLGLTVFGNTLASDITSECGGNLPPPCAGSVTDPSGASVLSANP